MSYKSDATKKKIFFSLSINSNYKYFFMCFNLEIEINFAHSFFLSINLHYHLY
jgi:hypothetical protein